MPEGFFQTASYAIGHASSTKSGLFMLVSTLIFTLWILKWTFFSFLPFVYAYFLRPAKNLKKYGKWAVVTGCTDGIGKAITEEFARKGLNVVLVSRTKSKLEEQAKELEAKYKIETEILTVDFTSEDTSIFKTVKETLDRLDVGILVNNVGMSYDHAEFYLNLEKDKVQKLIRINIWSVVEMTNIVLPKMVERKRGAIINVSSASSFVNEPLYAVYSATKAFVNNYSAALHYEYKDQGVDIQSQVPAFVATKLSKIRKASFFVCSPRTYAKAFLHHIGSGPVVVSYWTHELQIAIGNLFPSSMVSKLLFSRGKDIRRRALAKKKAQ